MEICHQCDNPSCVNPAHLFVGTQADNMRDCKVKDRHSRGERQPKSKLTEGQVLEIRRRYAIGGRGNGYRVLAREFGVSESLTKMIVTRQRWTHI